ncbi:uncharacterized protein LOC143202861 isoform X2 [Rhynchophorus ferrugineus]|uniref:uncharacterized protein LOC143202861 isoform X2 n=1 Tax=Rhynchophorus ferrugineus TaxID=354439 RepID=UPI003FCDBAA0
MADKSTTIISLPQMVDLALNSPEVGIVNFTVLHSLLHVIVNQLDLGEINVEFRGSDSERLQNYIATAKPGPIVTLTEYTVGPDGKGRKKRRGGRRKSGEEKVKKDENQKEKEIAIIRKEEDVQDTVGSSESYQTIVVVEPASREKLADTPKFTIALTKEQLGKLQKDIKDLQKQVKELTEMPGNIGLIDAIRSSKDGSNSPILDMFQILTLVKRLDATEAAMNKLASMMEDLAKGQANLVMEAGRQSAVAFKDETKPSTPSQGAMELVAKSQELRQSLDGTIGGGANIVEISNSIKELEQRVTKLENAKPTGSRRVSIDSEPTKSSMKKTSAVASGEFVMPEGGIDLDSTDLSQIPPTEAIAFLQRGLIDLKEFFSNNDSGAQALKEVLEMKDALLSKDNDQNMPPDVKLGQMDLRINELKEQVSTLDTVYHQQFANIKDKIDHLDKEISAIWERINTGLPGGEASAKIEGQNISEICDKLVELQEEMNELAETAHKLMAEKEGKESTLEVMAEQIELLKTVKADKEDLEDALADKADACQINRKVSHEQFDAAYDEITKALEDNLFKLKEQEELWTQSLNELQREIGNKLDKMELMPLKDFINAKLKGIQDKVKKISSLKQEHEAAGTKCKILRNVNCISCDADVVMKKQTDITLLPKPYAMPPPKSPGPYLAYELDQLRKNQKTLPNSKNLNMFESAIQFAKMKTADKDHICNRYCGGSHTVTTPQQRVMRVGHFMEQWGPEISPINEVLVKGTDGQFYKGRDDAMLKSLANERPPSARVDGPSILITECNKDDKNQVKERESHQMNEQSRGLPDGSVTKARPKSSFEQMMTDTDKKLSIKRSSIRSAEIK